MKMMTLMLLFSITLYSYSQDSDKQVFVEFVVSGETTPQLLKKVNHEFQANPNFQATRMDIPTERFFGVYKKGIAFDQQWFVKEFQKFGLTIHCLNTGYVGEKSYQHLARKDCPEINTK